MEEFKDIIQKYLQQRSDEDALFAQRFANPKKSIDECCRYILGEARKRGNAVVMADAEVFGLAIHYYDEENIKVEKVPFGNSISSSTHKVELTEEEKIAAREAAIKRLTEEQYQSLKKKPVKKREKVNVQQMNLF